MVKNLPAMQEIQVQSLGQKDPVEETATHSIILAWDPVTLWPGISTSSVLFSSSCLSLYETVIFVSQMLSALSLSPSKRTSMWPILFITVSLIPRAQRAHNR